MVITLFSASVYSEQRNCSYYPYPEGIFLKKKFMRKKQLIYTKSVSIRSKNIEMVEFIKEKADLHASSSLFSHIKKNFPNLKDNDIGMYKIYSCINNKGTYKISYGQRVGRLKGLEILQKSQNFIINKLYRD